LLIKRSLVLKSQSKNIIWVLLLFSIVLMSAPLAHAEFRASDHDGFQRPKETKAEPNKANEEKVKKEGNLPAKDQNESKGSIYEDMDGFKRPKKDQ
jgi:flagellar basal body-associated protein FliL